MKDELCGKIIEGFCSPKALDMQLTDEGHVDKKQRTLKSV